MRAGFTRFALVSMALAAATAVELGRQSGVPAWRSIWAEDGTIFLSDALNESFFATLFHPYAGYMLFVPRVSAEIVVLFPLADAAFVTALIASFIVASVAVFVYYASSTVLCHRASRGALAAAVILLPAAGFETSANLANLNWYLVFACFWALLFDGHSPGALAVRTVITLVTPLSTPLAVFLAPLLFLRPPVRSGKAEMIPRLAFLSSLGIQAIVVVRAPAGSANAVGTPFSVTDLPPIFAVRVAGSFLFGDRFLDSASRSLGPVFEVGSVLLLVLILGAALRGLDRRRRNIALLAAWAAAAYFVLPLAIRGTSAIWPAAATASLGGSRYFVVPILFLLVILLLGLDARLVAPHSESRTIWLSAAAFWLASVGLLNYSATNDRSAGPDWKAALLQAQRTCRNEGTVSVDVPIAPGGSWSARVPCRR